MTISFILPLWCFPAQSARPRESVSGYNDPSNWDSSFDIHKWTRYERYSWNVVNVGLEYTKNMYTSLYMRENNHEQAETVPTRWRPKEGNNAL